MKCLGVFCKTERKIRTYRSYKKISFDNFKSCLSHNLANEYDNSYLKFEKYFVTLLDKCGRQKKKVWRQKKITWKILWETGKTCFSNKHSEGDSNIMLRNWKTQNTTLGNKKHSDVLSFVSKQ